MRKKLLFLIVFALLLCSVSSVFSKGTLFDLDAFETYYGKTKSEVKEIAPIMTELSDLTIVDFSSSETSGDKFLGVKFDDNETVVTVDVILDNTALSYMNMAKTLEGALSLGATYLGLDQKDMRIMIDSEDMIISKLSDGTICSTQPAFEDHYLIICTYLDLLDVGGAASADSKPVDTGESLVTLVSAKYQGDVLIATFVIENTGKKNIDVSWMDFSAKDSDNKNLNKELFDCPGDSLKGTVAPGDKLTGNICFTNSTHKSVNIIYTPDLFSDKTYTFTVK